MGKNLSKETIHPSRKRIVAFLLVLTIVAGLFPTVAFADTAPIDNGILLSAEDLSVYQYDGGSITALVCKNSQVVPDAEIEWESSNPNILLIQSPAAIPNSITCQFLAVGTGEATITARAEGFTQTCKVTVTSPLELSMNSTGTITLTDYTYPGDNVPTAPDEGNEIFTVDCSINECGKKLEKSPKVGDWIVATDGTFVVTGIGEDGKIGVSKLPDPSGIEAGTQTTWQVDNYNSDIIDCEMTDRITAKITPKAAGRTEIEFSEPTFGLSAKVTVYVDTYCIIWDVDGIFSTSYVAKGELPEYPNGAPSKEATDGFVYSFTEWQPALAAATKHQTYVAQFEETRRVTLTMSQSELTMTLNGEEPTYTLTCNVSPSLESLGQQLAWSSDTPDVVSVSQDGVLTAHAAGEAIITARVGDFYATCNVTVENGDGFHTITFIVPGVSSEKQVLRAGETPTPTINTEKPEDDYASYAFTGWKPEIAPVTGDATYTAQYDEDVKLYTVQFKNYDGTILQTLQKPFGSIPIYSKATPTKPSEENTAYVFSTWEPAITSVVASTEPIVYTATFRAVPKAELEYELVISESEHTGYIGDSFRLTVETNPDGIDLSELVWWSSDPNYATVEQDGTVTLVGEGTTSINVTDGAKSAFCTVTVSSLNYTITWEAAETGTFQTTVADGVIPTYPFATPAKATKNGYYYTFEGWEPEPTASHGNATYRAKMTAHKVASFRLNNTTLSLAVGDSAALEVLEVYPEDAAITWSSSRPDVASVDGDGNVQALGQGTATITAKSGVTEHTCVVTVRAGTTYEITWLVDGQEPYKTIVAKGETPVYDKETPTKAQDEQYSYTFKDWYPTIVPADDNKSYMAQWNKTEREYTVTWVIGKVDVSGYEAYQRTVVEKYHYGEIPTPPSGYEIPTDGNYSHTFLGWEPSVVLREGVKADTVITAKYRSEKQAGITLNHTAASLKIGERLQLRATTYPQMAYGWSSDNREVATVDDEGMVRAVGNGTATIKCESENGQYFATCKITVAEEVFTVRWDVDGNITEQIYSRGQIPSYNNGVDPVKEATPQYTYKFTSWSPAIVSVTEDVTYTANFQREDRYYTVTWANDGDSTTEQYLYGTTPSYKGITSKPSTAAESWVFRGWSPELSEVTRDVTYTADYQRVPKTYSITWDVGGKKTQTVWEYGQTPKFEGSTNIEPDANYTYKFKGWNTPIAPVTGDATYVAQYDKTVRKYTITWNVDGKLTQEQYEYGQKPSFKGSTDKAATNAATYVFNGWNETIANVTGDKTYIATYKTIEKTYTITFKNWDNSTLGQPAKYKYGEMPSYTGIPTKPNTTANGKTVSYTFDGWTPDIATVTKDATYVAKFKASDGSSTISPDDEDAVTVTFKNWDLTVLETKVVKAGTVPTYGGATPTRPTDRTYRYSFKSWSPSLEAVTKDTTYIAQYYQQGADYLILTQTMISEAQKNEMSAYEFPCGILYITSEGIKALAEYKDIISVNITQSDNTVTAEFYKGSSDKVITDDIPGLIFLAREIYSGDSIEISKGTEGKDYEVEPFSVISKAGAYVNLPGTCKFRPQSAISKFVDVVDNAWHSSAIYALFSRKMMVGTGANMFSTEKNITRGMACTVLYRLSGEPSFVGGTAFSDVDPYAWYAKAVFWASANNLLPGYDNGSFGVNKAITREDMALLFYNYAAYIGKDVSQTSRLGKYHDAGVVSAANTTAMEWTVHEGIIVGRSNTKLEPKGKTTRGEFATIIYRFLQSFMKIDDDKVTWIEYKEDTAKTSTNKTQTNTNTTKK